MAGWDDPAGRIRELETERYDLLSRLACVVEATYWDRPYDERIAAIRGMGDLATNGMTPDSTDWKARAEALQGAVEKMYDTARQLAAMRPVGDHGDTTWGEGYKRAQEQWETELRALVDGATS